MLKIPHLLSGEEPELLKQERAALGQGKRSGTGSQVSMLLADYRDKSIGSAVAFEQKDLEADALNSTIHSIIDSTWVACQELPPKHPWDVVR
jgi:hypothetical protein